ncbi:hypothetical protein XH97_12745 [Bradyrhizobium sp. CCBAU 53380]|nr:hypothetical protein [Bradyrhizobium sp. CCBAU 53380]
MRRCGFAVVLKAFETSGSFGAYRVAPAFAQSIAAVKRIGKVEQVPAAFSRFVVGPEPAPASLI